MQLQVQSRLVSLFIFLFDSYLCKSFDQVISNTLLLPCAFLENLIPTFQLELIGHGERDWERLKLAANAFVTVFVVNPELLILLIAGMR